MHMKAFIKNLSILFFILFLIFFSVNYFQSFYNSSPEHYKLQYEEIIKKKEKVNSIIIGTSHATHSIRPSILDEQGLNFYNFSINGASPGFYTNWFNELFLKEYPIPEYCIFSVDWFMFDDEWLWRHFEQDAEYFPFSVYSTMFFNSQFNKKDLIDNRFPFLKYRKQLTESLKLVRGDSKFIMKEYDKGFVPIKTEDKYRLFERTESQYNFKIKENQVDLFDKLVNRLKSLKVKMIFVMTPEYNIDINEYKGMRSIEIINNISKKNNIPFLNYNTTLRTDLNENIEYFDDWGHMNAVGSLKFSTLLKDEIYKITHNEILNE